MASRFAFRERDGKIFVNRRRRPIARMDKTIVGGAGGIFLTILSLVMPALLDALKKWFESRAKAEGAKCSGIGFEIDDDDTEYVG